MTHRTGQFVWRELMTTNATASIRFYTEVLGWSTETMRAPGLGEYTMCNAGERRVAGIMTHVQAGIPAMWGGSVSVTDVDAAAQRATEAGGTVVAPPADAGGMGRYAALLDAQGALINVWRGAQGDGPLSNPPGIGELCWEQLNTGAPADAFTFYAKLFGWTHAPMAAAPGIEVLSSGDVQVASVMQAPPGVPAHWLSYVLVDKLTSAHARVKLHGGKVMVDRIDVPGIGAIGVIQDNVGAVIGLFEAPTA